MQNTKLGLKAQIDALSKKAANATSPEECDVYELATQ
jgi:hypothetical protein